MYDIQVLRARFYFPLFLSEKPIVDETNLHVETKLRPC